MSTLTRETLITYPALLVKLAAWRCHARAVAPKGFPAAVHTDAAVVGRPETLVALQGDSPAWKEGD